MDVERASFAEPNMRRRCKQAEAGFIVVASEGSSKIYAIEGSYCRSANIKIAKKQTMDPQLCIHNVDVIWKIILWFETE